MSFYILVSLETHGYLTSELSPNFCLGAKTPDLAYDQARALFRANSRFQADSLFHIAHPPNSWHYLDPFTLLHLFCGEFSISLLKSISKNHDLLVHLILLGALTLSTK